MTTELDALIEALAKDARRINDFVLGENPAPLPDRVLRDVAGLWRVVARLVKGRTPLDVSRAFGAPGNWGYGTPIGDALKRYYDAADRAAAGVSLVATVEARAAQVVRDMEALGELAGQLSEADHAVVGSRIIPLIEEAEARMRQRCPHLFGGAP